MGRYPKISSEKVAEILNKASLGGSLAKVALATEVAHSTVDKVIKDFPLWDWFRTHEA